MAEFPVGVSVYVDTANIPGPWKTREAWIKHLSKTKRWSTARATLEFDTMLAETRMKFAGTLR